MATLMYSHWKSSRVPTFPHTLQLSSFHCCFFLNRDFNGVIVTSQCGFNFWKTAQGIDFKCSARKKCVDMVCVSQRIVIPLETRMSECRWESELPLLTHLPNGVAGEARKDKSSTRVPASQAGKSFGTPDFGLTQSQLLRVLEGWTSKRKIYFSVISFSLCHSCFQINT